MSRFAPLVIEPLLNENGAFTTAAETKAIVGELQAECFRGKITFYWDVFLFLPSIN